MVYRPQFRFEGAGGRGTAVFRGERGLGLTHTARRKILAAAAGWPIALAACLCCGVPPSRKDSTEQLSAEKCSTTDRSPERNTEERNTKARNTKARNTKARNTECSTSPSPAEPSTRSPRIRQSRADHSPAAASARARRFPQHEAAGRNRAADGEGHRLRAAQSARWRGRLRADRRLPGLRPEKSLCGLRVLRRSRARCAARMSRREDIYDDDQVEIMLDTFHDRRRAYAFQTTPLGVQWDAIWTEASRDEDQRQFRYVVRYGVGFARQSDRVAGSSCGWQFRSRACAFRRRNSRSGESFCIAASRARMKTAFWPHISYKGQGRLGQAATLYGLEGISPGHNIELIPYGLMRGFRALDTRDPANPYFQNADAQGQPGMDAKFVIHDHFVVDVTANPDFSQVESEDPQITVNQRYAVYFPEKRPFFLENEDFFRTPLDLFFTRNIGDPSAGIRLTGKDGPYSVGLMAADDRSPGPGGAGLQHTYSGMRSYFTIARVSRDIFRQSSVGALYTDWECPTTGEFNRIGGVDTRLKFNPNWTLDGQAVVSSSNLNLELRSQSLSLQLRQSRQWQLLCRAGREARTATRRPALHLRRNVQRHQPGIRDDSGIHQSRRHSRDQQEADYRFRPKKGWILSWGPSLSTSL